MNLETNAGYKNSGESHYAAGYQPFAQDNQASGAIEALESKSTAKAMLEKFIKEIKMFNLYGSGGPQGKLMHQGMQFEHMNPQHKAGFIKDQALADQIVTAFHEVLDYIAVVGDKCNGSTFLKWLEGRDESKRKSIL